MTFGLWMTILAYLGPLVLTEVFQPVLLYEVPSALLFFQQMPYIKNIISHCKAQPNEINSRSKDKINNKNKQACVAGGSRGEQAKEPFQWILCDLPKKQLNRPCSTVLQT